HAVAILIRSAHRARVLADSRAAGNRNASRSTRLCTSYSCPRSILRVGPQPLPLTVIDGVRRPCLRLGGVDAAAQDVDFGEQHTEKHLCLGNIWISMVVRCHR